MAQVRIAELAAQNWLTVLGFAADLSSATDGRARPAPANPAAMSAPVPLSSSRAVRPRRPGLLGLTMLGLEWAEVIDHVPPHSYRGLRESGRISVRSTFPLRHTQLCR